MVEEEAEGRRAKGKRDQANMGSKRHESLRRHPTRDSTIGIEASTHCDESFHSDSVRDAEVASRVHMVEQLILLP